MPGSPKARRSAAASELKKAALLKRELPMPPRVAKAEPEWQKATRLRVAKAEAVQPDSARQFEPQRLAFGGVEAPLLPRAAEPGQKADCCQSAAKETQ